MALLAGFACLGIAIGALQPFAVRIVDHCAVRYGSGPDHAAKDAIMTRCAVLALGKQRQIRIAAWDIHECPEEKLLAFFWTVELHGENAGHIWWRQFGLWIDGDIADLVAEVAVDTFTCIAFQRQRNGVRCDHAPRALDCQTGMTTGPATVLIVG